MSIPPIWGDIGMKKWSPFLDLGAQSPIFGHLKMGTFKGFRGQKLLHSTVFVKSKYQKHCVGANAQ